jgi:tetratricopeptide (TPR) repeat protein
MKTLIFISIFFTILFLNVAYAEPSLPDVYKAIESGQLAKADSMMKEVLQNHPNSAKAHYVAAELYLREGKIKEARNAFSRAKNLAPDLPFATQESIQNLTSQLASGIQSPQRQNPPPQPASQAVPMTMSDIICQTHEMVMLNQILPFRQQGIMGVGEAQQQFNSEDDAGTRVFLKQYVRQLYADPVWGEKTLSSGQFVKACAKVHRGY